jgi:hypothetical protein
LHNFTLALGKDFTRAALWGNKGVTKRHIRGMKRTMRRSTEESGKASGSYCAETNRDFSGIIGEEKRIREI